ncbi:MAG: hypothetical protein CM15mP3_06690 [Candidatus Poseidoniales archaeon]|nr:MAG: hypothetical protein CM15mP3_06690 [Candidatus Poseidoniales archaeon]
MPCPGQTWEERRLDGFFLGTTRLLLSDGYPIISSDEDKRSEVDDSEE